MPQYRSGLPQLSGDIFLTDAGVETDLIFNHGIEIREFAAHTLLPTPEGRAALARYFEGFLRLAKEMDTGFILDSVTCWAHLTITPTPSGRSVSAPTRSEKSLLAVMPFGTAFGVILFGGLGSLFVS